MDRLQTLYQALNSPARRVLWIITVISAVLIGFSLTLVKSLLLAQGLFDIIATSMPFILSFVAVISAISVLYNRVQFGAWLFFAATLLSMLIIPFIQEGFAFPAAVLVLVVTILIPLQIAKKQFSTISIAIGFLTAGAIIGVDSYWTGQRAEVGLENLQSAQISTIGLAVILFISIIWLYNTFYLRTKLLMLSLGASLLSIIAIASASNFYTQVAISQVSQDTLLLAAENVGRSIDDFVEFNTEIIKSEATLPAFTSYLSGAETGEQSLADVQRTIEQLAKRDPAIIGSYALLDKNGFTVWDSYAPDINSDKSDRDYFITPFTRSTSYVSWVRFSPTSPDHAFYISAPVFDPRDGTVLGVLRVRFRTLILSELIQSSESLTRLKAYAILLDEYNIILANSIDTTLNLRSARQLSTQQIDFLRAQGRLPSNLANTEISLEMTEFANGLENINATPYFESRDAVFGEPVQGVAIYLSKRPWKIAFVQLSSFALAPIQQQTRLITTVALLTGMLVGLATLFVSRTVTGPIARLTQTAEKISAGNLDVHAELNTQDELGILAATINEMSEQLKQTLAGLETTISDRTADLEQRSRELAQRSIELEAANHFSERRAVQLLAVSSVANAIATVQNLDELLPLITRTISHQFNFYHVGIFLNDSGNQFAILRAANSEGGQRMLLRGHRLKIGETGIVGNVASTGRPRIALDTGADSVFFNNPDLPDTRSEIALPLRSGPVVIGVLDVQSLEANAFSADDIEIISVLAGQVSTAIRNAQLFEEIQRTATELELLLQQDSREQWQRVIQSHNRTGYYFDGSVIKILEAPPQKPEDVVLIPITVRGQLIGKLGIRTPSGYRLKPDELDVIRAVSDRLAISAENARLLEDSQLRANKERTISRISERIGSSSNLDGIFHTFMEELGQVIPGSEIVVHFNQEENDSLPPSAETSAA